MNNQTRDIKWVSDQPAGRGMTDFYQQKIDEYIKRDIEERNKKLNDNLEPLVLQLMREMNATN